MSCSRRARPATFSSRNILTSGLSRDRHAGDRNRQRFASFLLGQVQTFTIDVQREVLKPRATIAEFFLQDDLGDAAG